VREPRGAQRHTRAVQQFWLVVDEQHRKRGDRFHVTRLLSDLSCATVLVVLPCATVLVVLLRLAIAGPGAFEALAQKRQQLFRRSKPQLSSRIDLLDRALEMASPRLRLGPEPENERPSHRKVTLR
jgi:hypothetical protein